MKKEENGIRGHKVPVGLKRCRRCGCYKGTCMDNSEKVKVSCACNPNICEKCNTPVYKFRICSNYYDEETGNIWHVPILKAWAHKCPDGCHGQLKNSFLINIKTGEDLLAHSRAEEKRNFPDILS